MRGIGFLNFKSNLIKYTWKKLKSHLHRFTLVYIGFSASPLLKISEILHDACGSSNWQCGRWRLLVAAKLWTVGSTRSNSPNQVADLMKLCVLVPFFFFSDPHRVTCLQAPCPLRARVLDLGLDPVH